METVNPASIARVVVFGGLVIGLLLGIVGQSTENREVDQSLRFKIAPSGTTFSAGTATSATDTQWHNRLSLEQALPGSLNVTTSVEDAGTGASRKSITAGFKKVW